METIKIDSTTEVIIQHDEYDISQAEIDDYYCKRQLRHERTQFKQEHSILSTIADIINSIRRMHKGLIVR